MARYVFDPEILQEVANYGAGLPIGQRWRIIHAELTRRYPGKVYPHLRWVFNSAGNLVCPHVEKLKDRFEVEYIDVEAQPQAVEEYGITNLPTVFFIRDDQLVQHKMGASESMIKELIRFAES